jgi:hypothetical protein
VHQEQSLTYRAMSSFPRSGALGHPLTGRRTVTSERCHSAARCIHPTGRRPGDQLAPDSATTGSTVGGKVAPARHQDQVARRALLSLLDRDREMTDPEFRVKLEAAGFGIFIPVFFVTTGLRFNLDASFANAATVARVPLFLLALLLVRGLPAGLYSGLVGRRKAVIAGILQATSLPFIVAAAQIGRTSACSARPTGRAHHRRPPLRHHLPGARAHAPARGESEAEAAEHRRAARRRRCR